MNGDQEGKFFDNFPGYLGYFPMKNDTIGMTINTANEFVRDNFKQKPIEQENLGPIKYNDYSQYHKDYFNKNFSRDYTLEEEKIFSFNSKEADTWINGSKYKIYPQHIPGYKAFLPGIYSCNLHGIGYSKITAKAIKGNYNKEYTVTPNERFISAAKEHFKKPRTLTEEGKNYKIIFYFILSYSILSYHILFYFYFYLYLYFYYLFLFFVIFIFIFF